MSYIKISYPSTKSCLDGDPVRSVPEKAVQLGRAL